MSNSEQMQDPVHAPESAFLLDLFASFSQYKIDYAVMRNHESLPFSTGGSDIDLLVSDADRESVLSILKEVADSAGAQPIGISEAPGFFKAYILGCNKDFREPWWGVRIDVNLGLVYKGLQLLDGSKPLPCEVHNSISVLQPGFSGVLGVLKEVLNNGIIPARYIESARQAATQDWPMVESLLSPMGPKALKDIRQAILGNSADVKTLCQQVRNDFRKHALLSRPLRFISGVYSSLAMQLKRYLSPSGKVIAILGTDGAGKSTIINAIKPALDQATHNTTVIKHLRPDFLPPLSRLKAGNHSASGPVTNPHASMPSGIVGSLLRIGYATLNYVLGYWFETRIQIAKQPTIVIFDRYAYDMVLDPRRFRISLHPAVIKFFVRFAPKPDLVFCLSGSPDVLAARKNEIPLDEVARQVRALQIFAAKHPGSVRIDTEQSVQACRNEVLRAISTYCRMGGVS